MESKLMSQDSGDKKEGGDRILWKSKFEFAFNVIGYSVGLGNIWRFSYLCFKDGGGVFLIPYLLVAAFCAIPLLFMEISIGQLTRQGCITCWNLVPLMRGIGFAAILMSIYFLVYYGLAISWCMIYFIRSFSSGHLPWATCGNYWNTNSCIPILGRNDSNLDFVASPISDDEKLSTAEFWDNYVLQRTAGIDDLGGFSNWHMFGCFTASWLICFLCIAKGIRTSGKAAYVTVIAPYVFMVILFFRGITLDGASDGIKFFVSPNITRLADPQVWLDAGSQVLFSIGVCFGSLIGLGSHNKQNFDCFKAAFVFVGTCCASSIFFGLIVFSFLGHMAFIQHQNISEVVEGGPGLVFQVLPSALSTLPLPQLWSATLFLALFGLAIDGSYAIIEGCIIALADYFPSCFKRGRIHLWRAVGCFVLMVFGLIQLFDGGIYIFEIINLYGASGICIMWLAFFESVAVAWLYGAERLFDDVALLIGYRPSRLMLLCIKYVTPSISMAIFIACCIKYSPLKMGDYEYPWWADFMGWILSMSVVLCVPLFAAKVILGLEGSYAERFQRSIQSQKDSDEKKDTGNSPKARDELSAML